MTKPRLFLCSGVKLAPDDARLVDRKVVELDSVGDDANVNLNLEDLARAFFQHVTARLTDLLEIAAYVYAADSSATRGKGWSKDCAVEEYDRDFRLVIPVRDHTFWNGGDVRARLQAILTFLTDDKWQIDFVPLAADRKIDPYLKFSQDDWPFHNVERVIMFSGGLDSLAGAVETGLAGGHLVLVSHRSKGMISQRQHELVSDLSAAFSGRVFHVPVWVNKDQGLGREHTQRSRSFLFAALGTVVAESVHAKGVRFFENGVVGRQH